MPPRSIDTDAVPAYGGKPSPGNAGRPQHNISPLNRAQSSSRSFSHEGQVTQGVSNPTPESGARVKYQNLLPPNSPHHGRGMRKGNSIDLGDPRLANQRRQDSFASAFKYMHNFGGVAKEGDPDSDKLSDGHTMVNLIKSALGAGSLSLPAAYKSGGIWASCFLTILFGAIRSASHSVARVTQWRRAYRLPWRGFWRGFAGMRLRTRRAPSPITQPPLAARIRSRHAAPALPWP